MADSKNKRSRKEALDREALANSEQAWQEAIHNGKL
jgi:hypothetical protein